MGGRIIKVRGQYQQVAEWPMWAETTGTVQINFSGEFTLREDGRFIGTIQDCVSDAPEASVEGICDQAGIRFVKSYPKSAVVGLRWLVPVIYAGDRLIEYKGANEALKTGSNDTTYSGRYEMVLDPAPLPLPEDGFLCRFIEQRLESRIRGLREEKEMPLIWYNFNSGLLITACNFMDYGFDIALLGIRSEELPPPPEQVQQKVRELMEASPGIYQGRFPYGEQLEQLVSQ